jgi:predicted ABC-type ATPase
MAPAKSTFLENLGAVFSEIVRPDEFALRLAPDAPESAALSAGKLAVNRMQELLARRESFAVETTRSGRLHQAIAHKAKYDGWQVRLVYIGLANAQLAIGRVNQRRLSGDTMFQASISWAVTLAVSRTFRVGFRWRIASLPRQFISNKEDGASPRDR